MAKVISYSSFLFSFFSPHQTYEEFSTKPLVTVKEKPLKNALMTGKSNVSLLILHLQKCKFVDFLYTNMQNSYEYPDYHLVLIRSHRLDTFF